MATLFTATLDGAQETPPTGSQASGQGVVVWNADAQIAAYTFTVRGLDFAPVTGQGEATPSPADDVTNAHFHNAPAGVAGPVVFGQIAPAQDPDDLVILQGTDHAVRNDDGSWTVSGVWEPTDPANVPIERFAEDLDLAFAGLEVPLYSNIHTTAFPGGEIRAQWIAEAGDVDWDAVAARVLANFEETGTWWYI